MGTQIITQPTTLKSSSTVIGATAGLSAVDGLTVYGDISASGFIRGLNSSFQTTEVGGNGSVGPYNLGFAWSTNSADYLVFVDGVSQQPSSYTITAAAGTGNITFTEAIPAGSKIVVTTLRGIGVNTVAAPTFVKYAFSTLASHAQYQIASGFTNAVASNYLVYLDGVMQIPDVDYTIQDLGGGIGAVTLIPTPTVDNIQGLVMSIQTANGVYAAGNTKAVDISQNSGAYSTVGKVNFKNGLQVDVAGGVAGVGLPVGTAGQTLVHNGTTWVAGTVGAASNILAWVNFDATKNASGTSVIENTNRFIRSSNNVSSVLRNAKADYTITFTNPLPSANYIMVGSIVGNITSYISVGIAAPYIIDGNYALKSANSFRIFTSDGNTDMPYDFRINEIAIIG